jgi:hypothetical protein
VWLLELPVVPLNYKKRGKVQRATNKILVLLTFMHLPSLVLVVTVTVVASPEAVVEMPEPPVWAMAEIPTTGRVDVARPVGVAETVTTALSVSGPTGIDKIVVSTCALD